MGLRRGPNVALPQGDIYPNGITLVPPDPDVQATVRPEGGLFQKSAGYETIRSGKTRFQHSHGAGIHFTPMRFAEDVGEYDSLPLLVDATTAVDHADLADLPGSGDLNDNGALTADQVAANEGVKMSETATMAPVAGEEVHAEHRSVPDMGDREPGRPLTQGFHSLLRNPAGAFRDEYQKDPVIAVGVAGLIVGGVYFLAKEFERQFLNRNRSASRSGGVSGAVAPVAAAPAAAVATSGGAVREAAQVASTAATEAGKAASEAANAAGDVAEAAADAVEEVTDKVADTVTE